MIEFVCIGFDIRSWPTITKISADATVWPQVEYLYEQAQLKLGLKENRFQLLQIETSDDLEMLLNTTKQVAGAVMVAIEIPLVVFNAFEQKGGYGIPIRLDLHEWDELGLDICDLNGFFSVLHMEVFKERKLDLFSEADMVDALLLSQAASVLVPEHTPFAIVNLKKAVSRRRLTTLKHQGSS